MAGMKRRSSGHHVLAAFRSQVEADGGVPQSGGADELCSVVRWRQMSCAIIREMATT